jgi:hypothetical protein
MSAFLCKYNKIWKRLFGGLAVCVTFISLCYTHVLYNAQTVEIGHEFYYLLSEAPTTQATAQFVQLQGGAGYVLTHNKREYVAYSVYLSAEESEKARHSLLETGGNATCLSVHCDKLYLKKTFDKHSAAQIKGAFESLYGCIQVLNGEIKRLEKGATQESDKRILNDLVRKLEYLSKDNPLQTVEYAQICNRAAKRITELTKGVVYVKDLRYVLCETCNDYLKLSKIFSL